MRIYIFGDSIAQGLWDSEGGWADRLKAFVQAEEVKLGFKTYHTVFNLGVDGDTTGKVLSRFETDIQARLWPGKGYAVIFAVGTNDTLHRNHEDYESTPDRYRGELERLSKLAGKYTEKIAFVDLTPVDEALTNPIRSSTTGKCFTNDRIGEFNETLHSFCDSRSLTCVKVGAKFLESDYGALLVDGLHPNDAGHKLIFHEVVSVVKPWLCGTMTVGLRPPDCLYNSGHD